MCLNELMEFAGRESQKGGQAGPALPESTTTTPSPSPQSSLRLKAPFPYFGGKSRVAHLVWERFGDVPNYVEPFAGSLAVLLARPGGAGRNETVNDKDCYVANFWRALQLAPEQVAYYADWPVNEADLHARHLWLTNQAEFRERMVSDPDYFDVKIAGWWVWGLSLWIGDGWCVHPEWKGRHACERTIKGVHALEKKRPPQLKRGGAGVHRSRQLPDISGDSGASGRGVHARYCADIQRYFEALASRLRKMRVCCGDWQRVLGPSPTTCIGLTGVFLDPPYAAEDRDTVYTHDSKAIASDVFRWAIEHGSNPKLRIAVCGYAGDHEFPADWTCVAWKANGGYGNQGDQTRGRENASRERIWFSPYCQQVGLFEGIQ